MSARNSLAMRLAAHLPLNLVQAGVGFGALAVFSHILNTDDFGRYALVLSCMALAHTLVFTWIEAAAFRFHAQAKAENALPDHFAALLGLSALATIAAGALTIAALATVNLSTQMLAAGGFAALATLARFWGRMARETERADHRVTRYSIMESLFLIGGLALGAGAILGFRAGPIGPFMGLAAIGCLLAMIDAPRLIAAAKGGAFSLARAQRYAAYGAPLALALVLDLASQTATRFALEASAGPAAVGVFAAGFGLAGRTLDLVFLWAGLAAAPLTLSAFESGGAVAAKAAAGKLFIALVGLAAPAAAGLAIVGPDLARVMIGPDLRDETILTLPWFALSGLLSGLTLYYFSEAFTLSRRTGLRAVLMLAPALCAVGLTLYWAPAHGALGASWALAVSSGFGLILMAFMGRRALALPVPPGSIAKVLLATAGMSAAVAAAPSLNLPLLNAAFHAVFGAMVYASLLIAMDFSGLRGLASAVWQRIRARVGLRAVEAQP